MLEEDQYHNMISEISQYGNLKEFAVWEVQ